MTPFDRLRLIAAADSPRQCVRCHADVHTNDPPHLCNDVRGRYNAYRNNRRQHLSSLVGGRRRGIVEVSGPPVIIPGSQVPLDTKQTGGEPLA